MSAKKDIGVLVVEDSALIAMDVQAVLEDAGYRVLGPVNSVAAGFALVETQYPDIALLDINLGRSDVFALADFLARRQTKLIFLSGHSESVRPEAHRHRTLIGKPFMPAQLLRALKDEESR